MAQQRETRLLNEWLWLYHRETPVWKNVPLGQYNVEEGAREYMSKAPRADAIYIEDDTINIVEAKVVDELKAIAELEMYKMLFRGTPAFTNYRDLPIELILLRARERPEVTQMCAEKGITCVTFTPSWVQEYLDDLIKKRRSR